MSGKYHINVGYDPIHYIVKYSCISVTCCSKLPLTLTVQLGGWK